MRMFWLLNLGIMKALIAIAFIAAVVMVIDIVMLIRLRRTARLARVKDGIDLMLAVAAVMPVVSCSMLFFGLIRATQSIGQAGTKDPRIIFIGLIEALLPLFFAVAKFFGFFIAWLILRAVHRRFMHEIDAAV